MRLLVADPGNAKHAGYPSCYSYYFTPLKIGPLERYEGRTLAPLRSISDICLWLLQKLPRRSVL